MHFSKDVYNIWMKSVKCAQFWAPKSWNAVIKNVNLRIVPDSYQAIQKLVLLLILLESVWCQSWRAIFSYQSNES